MKNALEILEEYAKEMDMDTQIDSTNIMEKQLSSPNVKHKWLYRRMKCTKVLVDLVEQKDGFINNTLHNNNPLHLSKAVVAAKAGNDPTYKELQRAIKDQEILVEYLDMSVNKILSPMGFDFKNLVDLMKMEQI